MPDPSSVVIVGGGLAAAKTAEALREKGYDGPVTVLSAEKHPPYERPPLSKGFLQGKAGFDDALVHPQEWYGEHDIDLRLDSPVVAVRTTAHEVETADGTRVPYGKLVLATGSTPNRLPIPGAENALTLRTREDSEALKKAFGEGRRIVIVGAGWIGLEVASAAKQAGSEVTVLESAELPLLGVMGREMAQVFADLHREHGVDLRTGVGVEEITDEGVRLADGETVAADTVVLGVGARPALEVANSAGVETDNGVLVDASMRTSEPDIYAVGDIANHDHPVLGRRIRVEHWANALNQPTVAAAAILGQDDTFDNLPYFYSDQFDLGMEYVGHAGPGEYAKVIVRGDLPGREFVAFWLDGSDHVVAAMNVNVWDVVDDIKPLIANRTVVDPGKLADPKVGLDDVAA